MQNTVFEEKYYFENQNNIVEGIAIDPLLPDDFYDMAHDERDSCELAHWWGRPFIVTVSLREESATRSDNEEKSGSEYGAGSIRYDVLCLTGGAWDRPSLLGSFSTVEEALALAKEKPQMYQLLDDEGFLDLPIAIKEAMVNAKVALD